MRAVPAVVEQSLLEDDLPRIEARRFCEPLHTLGAIGLHDTELVLNPRVANFAAEIVSTPFEPVTHRNLLWGCRPSSAQQEYQVEIAENAFAFGDPVAAASSVSYSGTRPKTNTVLARVLSALVVTVVVTW